MRSESKIGISYQVASPVEDLFKIARRREVARAAGRGSRRAEHILGQVIPSQLL
jgi:hypothetical protein